MTTLAESLVTLIPCSPLKKWPFLPYMLHRTQSAGGMEPFLLLIAAPRNSSFLQNLSSSGKSQPVPSFCPLLFPTYPLSSGGLHRSHDFKFISAPELPLNSTLILPLAYLIVPCPFLIDMSSSKPKSWFPQPIPSPKPPLSLLLSHLSKRYHYSLRCQSQYPGVSLYSFLSLTIQSFNKLILLGPN